MTWVRVLCFLVLPFGLAFNRLSLARTSDLLAPLPSTESAVYQLFVRATDGGAVPLVADVPVDVLVLADSEGLPVFDPPRTGAAGVFLKESDPVGEWPAAVFRGSLIAGILTENSLVGS